MRTREGGYPGGYPAAVSGICAVAAVVLLMKMRKPKEVLKPVALRISAEPNELLADGKSMSTISIELLNGKGELAKAPQDIEVRLTTSLGTITGPITILEGESTGIAPLTSSTEFGEVTVSAEGKGLKRTSITFEFVERKRYCMHCGTRMPLDASQCRKCGRVPPSGVDVKNCLNCGEIIPTVAKFCSSCGSHQPEERNP